MKYDITNKNLYTHKANYSYYPYKGDIFVNSYIEQRKNFIRNLKTSANCSNVEIMQLQQQMQADNFLITIADKKLIKLRWFLIHCIETDLENEALVLILLKSFSVNQRLYNYYTEKFVPIKKSLYSEIPNYILFSKLCCKLYKKTQHLTYLNCLIKSNDIITSLPIPCLLNKITKEIIEFEIEVIKELM